MKILQVNCHYNYGSTGKIMYDIHNFLVDNNVESIQCYARGITVHKPNVYRIANEYLSKIGKLFNKFYNLPLEWGEYATRNLIRIIEAENPDVVHLHCVNAYTMNVYSALDYLKKKEIPTIITLHAEFMHTGGCAYAFECEQWRSKQGCVKCPPNHNGFVGAKKCKKNWMLMNKAFDGFKNDKIILASVSPWLMNRAKMSPIMAPFKHTSVLNGIDTNVFKKRSDKEINLVRQEYGIIAENIILHVTSDFNAKIKGGEFVLEFDSKFQESFGNNYQIVVVGPATGRESSGHVKFLGIIRDQFVLSVLYSMSKIVLLTSKKETFSMICAESLCCGTPIVGFKAGAPETISIPEYSYFCEFADVDTLVENAKTIILNDYDSKDISLTAISRYSSTIMAMNYYTLYSELLGKNG